MHILKPIRREISAMHTGKKLTIAIGTIVAACACDAQPVEGLVHIRSDGSALLFTTHEPVKGEEIRVQYAGKIDEAKCCALARLASSRPVKTEDWVSDELGGKEIKAYRLSIDPPQQVQEPFIGIAVIGTSLAINNEGSELLVQSRGTKLSIRTCLSHEGVNLFAFNGSKKVSHLYMYLGYGVQPNCSDSIYESE